MPAASFHLVNYPSEATLATVFCATTAGTVSISAGTADANALPLSPIYNLNNPASGAHLQIPLGAEVIAAAVTVVNDSREPADVTVAVGVSVLPVVNQNKLEFTRTIPARTSTFFHIVFHPAI